MDVEAWKQAAKFHVQIDDAVFYVRLVGSVAHIVGVYGELKPHFRRIRLSLVNALPITPSKIVWHRSTVKKEHKIGFQSLEIH